MILAIGRRKFSVASYKEASEKYVEVRADRPSSRMPNGQVFENAQQVAYVSYNGRVWPGSTYDAASVPVYDNRNA